jgi:hypothetical protein
VRPIRDSITVTVFLFLAACGSSSNPSAPAVEFVQAPQVTESPADAVPLSRVVSLETNTPTRLQLELDDRAGHHISITVSRESTQHQAKILGLKAGRAYDLEVTAISAQGRSATWESPAPLSTAPLPEGFPPITVLVSDPEAMEPGVTVFNVRPRNSLGSDGQTELKPYLVALDARGDVVWFLEGAFGQASMLENGNLLATDGIDNSVQEISMLGELVATWYSTGGDSVPDEGIMVDAGPFHHDAVPLNGGESLLVPVWEFRTIEDFPTDEQDPNVRETTLVRDAPVIEFTADGTVVNSWDFLDILKPTRIGFDATQIRDNARNWAHTNAVIYDAVDDAIIASLRHQDAVVKVSRATGELIWILGNPANWEGFEEYLLAPVGAPFDWQYHQHAPMLTSDRTIVLFDNGNNRASPFTGEVPVSPEGNFSRAVEYAVDQETMTVRQIWEWGLRQSGEQIFAPFLGDANLLPQTDNVLITFAGICKVDGVFSDSVRTCSTSIRVIEVSRVDNDRVVFDVLIEEPDPAHMGWRSYRSERLPSLYGPGG